MLLKDDVVKSPKTPLEKNISEVVHSLERMAPSLIKNVAQRALYDFLYHIIEKEYEEPEYEPETRKGEAKAKAERDLNRKLNSAIGRALENAISGELKALETVQTLRKELREKIIEALTPK
jgi:hypothetical protein